LAERAGRTAPRPSRAVMDQAAIRRHNLSVVFRQVRDHGPCSRAQLAVATGLTKTGVAKIVDDLIDRGLVRDLGVIGAPRVGRPASMLEVDGAALACVGLELNLYHAATVVTDLVGRELFRARRAMDGRQPPATVLAAVRGLLDQSLEAATEACRAVGSVTVTLPGLTNPAAGMVVHSPSLGWRDVPLGAEVARLLGGVPAPVAVDSIANLAALAESRRPEHKELHSLVRLELGAGIGAGHVVDGRLQRGAGGSAGAIGHTMVDPGPRAPRCRCGRTGCLDAFAGLTALLGAAAPDLLGSRADDPAEQLAEVARRAARGERRALAGIAEVGAWVGRAAAMVINLQDPQVLVLGGYVKSLEPWIMPTIEGELEARVFAPDRAGCQVSVSPLGPDGALAGAVQLGRDRALDDLGPATGGGSAPRAADA
jgi:predicted NBD/HSP70 family sugar kinase